MTDIIDRLYQLERDIEYIKNNNISPADIQKIKDDIQKIKDDICALEACDAKYADAMTQIAHTLDLLSNTQTTLRDDVSFFRTEVTKVNDTLREMAAALVGVEVKSNKDMPWYIRIIGRRTIDYIVMILLGSIAYILLFRLDLILQVVQSVLAK